MTTKGTNANTMIAAALNGDSTGHIAAVGVGDDNTAESTSHNDLQAASNKLRKATTPSVSTSTITCTASFGSTDANWAWKEVAVFNNTVGGNMLIRSINGGVSLGTKASGETWDLTITIPVT